MPACWTIRLAPTATAIRAAMEKPGVRAAYVKARITNGVPICESRTAGSDRPAAAIATSSTMGPMARRTSRFEVSLGATGLQARRATIAKATPDTTTARP